LEAKLGDFGLSREGQTGVGIEVSRVFGTKPYLPYEFLAKKILSTKVDVYSFGVVLFEVASE
jgi:interleukin-1 receptor-associated kinase 1